MRINPNDFAAPVLRFLDFLKSVLLVVMVILRMIGLMLQQ